MCTDPLAQIEQLALLRCVTLNPKHPLIFPLKDRAGGFLSLFSQRSDMTIYCHTDDAYE